LCAEATLVDTEKRPVEDCTARRTWVHERPDRRWSTTTRPARAGYPYPDKVNPRPVSAEDGPDSESFWVTPDRVRFTDTAWTAVLLGRATACAGETAPNGETSDSAAANTIRNR
jgi:hypothetical protein